MFVFLYLIVCWTVIIDIVCFDVLAVCLFVFTVCCLCLFYCVMRVFVMLLTKRQLTYLLTYLLRPTYLLTYLRVSPTTSAARVQYSLKIVGDGLGLRRPSESPRATSREREQYIA